MEQRLLGEPAHVVALGRVVGLGPLPAHRDQPGQPQLGKMLRYSGSIDAKMAGKLVDRVFPVQQRPDNLQPGLIGQELEGLHRQVQLLASGFPYYLRIHADNYTTWKSGYCGRQTSSRQRAEAPRDRLGAASGNQPLAVEHRCDRAPSEAVDDKKRDGQGDRYSDRSMEDVEGD